MGIVDRSRQFPQISRFIPQEFIEGTQEPDIVDFEMNASPFCHDSCSLDRATATEDMCNPTRDHHGPEVLPNSPVVEAALGAPKTVNLAPFFPWRVLRWQVRLAFCPEAPVRLILYI